MSKIDIDFSQCNLLMPMHVLLSDTGYIESAGATFKKLFPMDVLGLNIFEILEVSRPKLACRIGDLHALAGKKIHFKCRGDHLTMLTGVVVPLSRANQTLLNLSFGISIVDAVRDYDLTSADFAATDLAVEMLYLVEAKGLAMAEIFALSQRLQNERDDAERRAATDGLTGLRNRRALGKYLKQYIKMKVPFSLVNMDLDHFKLVNDTFGHSAGDYVLSEVAEILKEETRSEDVVARVGGDEFVLLLKGIVQPDRLSSIADRLIQRVCDPLEYDGQLCRVSCSLGSTITDFYEQPSAELMLKDADTALYQSKGNGRACHTVFSAG